MIELKKGNTYLCVYNYVEERMIFVTPKCFAKLFVIVSHETIEQHYLCTTKKKLYFPNNK